MVLRMVTVNDPTAQLKLPPGFRFYPTDEELMVRYLCPKIAGKDFALQIIGDVNLYKFDPWELPSKAMFGEKEWYFFSPRDRKYPNGSRPNRVTGSGYWKATGTDKVITSEGRKVGIKKALVFYVGKAPKGSKTNWIMHEYRLCETTKDNTTSSRLDDWVLCRIYKKNSTLKKTTSSGPSTTEWSQESPTSSSSRFDGVLDSLPAMEDTFLNFPTSNEVKTFNEEDQKVNIRKLDTRNYDGTNREAFGLTDSVNYPNPQKSIFMDPTFNMQMEFVKSLEDGIRSQRMENSGYSFSINKRDPFGIRYPTQPSSSGHRQ